MKRMPNMLMAGAAGRNLGKTEFLCRAIREQSKVRAVIGIKVTTIDDPQADYRNIDGRFIISREEPADDHKDTHRMFRSGATAVYWLRVKRPHLQNGLDALLSELQHDDINTDTACLVMESGGARNYINPGLFLIIQEHNDQLKPSCAEVAHLADELVNVNADGWDILPEELVFENGQWGLKEHATAIILSGGESSRMGKDKALLNLNKKPLIQSLAENLAPNFMGILISGSPDKYGFTGYNVVEDREPGSGPLMGLLCTLQASEHDLNFVTTCDVPDISIPFARRMLREINNHDAVMPRVKGKEQPLFAVYRKSIIPKIEALLAQNRRAVYALVDNINVHYIETDADWYFNLNTPEDVENYKAGLASCLSAGE